MSKRFVESLESRQHFSITHLQAQMLPNMKANLPSSGSNQSATVIVKESTAAIRKSTVTKAAEGNLTAAQVSQILAQAASQARAGQAIAVTDREGKVLGVFGMTGATQDSIDKAIARARTAAYFQSTQNAFTTRTARFIIQDHFPFPIRNTAGGPLYGVEFSSFTGTDILSSDQVPGVSGDPGGVPLYLNGVPVGGIGVAGDGSDLAPRFDLAANGQKVFSGKEEKDFDESVAMAGAQGVRAPASVRINANAPKSIQATQIFLPGPALRFPFTVSAVAKKNAFRTLAQIVTAGEGTIITAPVDSQPNPFPKVDASVFGVAGELKNTTVAGYGVVASDDTIPEALTVDDVNTIISQAVAEALNVRAAIRLKIGVSAVVHIAVTDLDGDVLGVFRMNDGTNFSFDVAVQKARTAAFFSDNDHAFSTRAIGFMSQRYFPAGIEPSGVTGPLFQLQNALTTTAGNLGTGPLANGITVFPGGVPLYKNGVLVGAIGISGDGVEQDDQIAYAGSKGFRPADSIRSDNLTREQVKSFIVGKVQQIQSIYNVAAGGSLTGKPFDQQAEDAFDERFVRLPYVKFARNPNI